MNPSNRREFLRVSGVAAAALSIGKSRILGANDRVRLAIIGLGGRGSDHVRSYLGIPSCDIVGLVDVNQAALERNTAVVERAGRAKPTGFSDMRKAFDDKEIDAVSMATPNHWHSLGTVWACQAGKDVYCEKPASHNPWEGAKMVEAARKYRRMVQIGSQSRSIPHKMEAMRLLNQGAIGKVYLAKGLCFKRRKSIGKKPDGPTPPGLDWDFFLGPAPMRAFNENRFKYNWHWFWDTGNGDIGNQGVHEMDVCRWGLGLTDPRHAGLKSVVSTGGKFAYDDDQETPNTQLATFDYGDRQLVFEVRGLLTNAEGALAPSGGNCVGNIFYGSEGYMEVDGNGYKLYKGEDRKLEAEGKRDRSMTENARHMTNFLDAVKSRDGKSLNAEVEIGVASAALCHFANISYRVGRMLHFDERAGKFTGDEQANALLTRKYRAPYVVPEKV
jgi:predicted dehydrogenase